MALVDSTGAVTAGQAESSSQAERFPVLAAAVIPLASAAAAGRATSILPLGATGVAFTNASHARDGLVTVTYTSPAANTTTTISSDSPDPSAVGQSVAVVTQSRPSPDRPRAGVNAYRKLSICMRNCVENDRRSINAFERL
jgi:hypothetical protein